MALAGDRAAFLATFPISRWIAVKSQPRKVHLLGSYSKPCIALAHIAQDLLRDVWDGIAVGSSAECESMNERAVDFDEFRPRLVIFAVSHTEEQGGAGYVCLASYGKGGG